MKIKVYTKTGDAGETSLFKGGRISKAAVRLEAYGTVDELNAFVGSAMSHTTDAEKQLLERIQHELFVIGADLATPLQEKIERVSEEMIARLENEIDAWNDKLPELHSFILPSGTPFTSALHVARAVCRRAERRVAALAEKESVSPLVLKYLNRLSDWFFVFGRLANQGLEKKWKG